eukprot:668620-Prymnesium_polylepis.1
MQQAHAEERLVAVDGFQAELDTVLGTPLHRLAHGCIRLQPMHRHLPERRFCHLRDPVAHGAVFAAAQPAGDPRVRVCH